MGIWTRALLLKPLIYLFPLLCSFVCLGYVLGPHSKAGYRAYALDLLGNGRSSKPFPTGAVAQALSGEARRPEAGPQP